MSAPAIRQAFPWLTDPEDSNRKNRPYTGNRTARIEMTVSPEVKACWQRKADNCQVSLPFLMHTAMDLLCRQIDGEAVANHTGMIGPDPLPEQDERA